jgi:hypothetical protein
MFGEELSMTFLLSKTGRRTCQAAVVFFSVLAFVSAQDIRSEFRGRVTDQAGLVVPGVTVQAKDIATGVVTASTSNQTGDYLIPFLVPGEYTLTASTSGFRTFVQEHLQLRLSDQITLNIALQIGEVTEQIVVSGQTPLIEVGNATLGQVMDNRRILDLPILNSNSTVTAMLAPGIVANNSGTSGSYGMVATQTSYDSGDFSANGSPLGGHNYIIDGAPNSYLFHDSWNPPTGLVQEIKVMMAPFDAAQGFSPSGTMAVTLKSGTNALHGEVASFMQNPALEANNFFANLAGIPAAFTRVLRLGMSVTGPVYIPKFYDGRNRTFFTFGYDNTHFADPRGTLTNGVPTANEKNGDFSNLLALGSNYQIYNPFSTAPVANGRFSRQPFPGNIIPPSLINPLATKLLDYYPPPNLPGTADGTNNWTTPGMEWTHYYTPLIRLDHYFSDKQRTFVRGNWTGHDQRYNVHFNEGTGAYYFQLDRTVQVNHVYTVNPRFLINLLASYTRYGTGTTPIQTPHYGVNLTQMGFSPSFVNQINQMNPAAVKVPSISISGLGVLADSTQSVNWDDVSSFAANATRILRNHTLRFGAEYRVYRDTRRSFGNSAGILTFDGTYTNGPLDNAPFAPMGQGLAAFLLGQPSSGSIDVNNSAAQRSSSWGLYLADDWKITSRLTLNLGLRYELELPSTERYNRAVSNFDFASPNPIAPQVLANYAANPIPQIAPSQFQVLGGLRFLGVNGVPRGLWDMNKKDFMPRFGLAYQINAKTAIRAGYGIYFDMLGTNRRLVNQTGFNLNTPLVASADNGLTYLASLNNPFPAGFSAGAGAGLGLATYVGHSISFSNRNIETPYTQRWQLSVQRELMHNTVVEAAYVGSRGVGLIDTRQWDAIPRQYLSTLPVRDQPTINLLTSQVRSPFYPLLPNTSLASATVALSQLLLPYPEFTGITSEENRGYNWYHSLQTRFERQLTSGFTLAFNWTWSKNMEAMAYLNATDAALERVISALDRTHRVVASGLWELPFGRGRRWLTSGLLNKIAGGWQSETLFVRQVGAPMGFGDAIFNGNLHDIELPSDQRTIYQWFNTSGFNRNSAQQLANNIITMPLRFSCIRDGGLNEWDTSLIKITPLRERVSLELRAELLNAFNHPTFAAPNTTPSSTAFGAVTALNQGARIPQFAVKLRF